MRRTTQSEEGIAFVLGLLVVVVLVVVGLVGYRISHTPSDATTTATTVQSSKVPATIKNSTDLQKSSDALDATPIDSGINPDQLDSDLNSIL